MARIDADRLRDSNAMAKAIFNGRTWIQVLHDDQREAIAADVQRTEPDMPREMDHRVGRKRGRESDVDKSRLIERHMGFAATALFSSDRIADSLTPRVRELYALLIQRSPRLTGEYRNSFRYILNGAGALRQAPTGLEYTDILGVINIAPYASTLEIPSGPKTFRRVFRAFNGKYRFELDIRLRYMQARDAKQRHYYALPVIELARKGIMGRNTGYQVIRRRFRRR